MDARVTELITEFEQAGLKSHGAIDIKSDWWFEDIILLVSEWRPVGTPLYLTLLIDPIIDKKVVWAVAISSSVPEQNKLNSIRQIRLNDVKQTNLPELVIGINAVALNLEVEVRLTR